MENNEVISLQEIEEIAKGELVQIPGWKKGTVISVRLRPIDITPEIVKIKKNIPNPLKKEAVEVFEGKKTNVDKVGEEIIDKPGVLDGLDIIAKLALAEPTYEEIQKRLPLVLEQKLAIFEWAMGAGGLEELKPFREQPQRDDRIGTDGKELRNKAE